MSARKWSIAGGVVGFILVFGFALSMGTWGERKEPTVVVAAPPPPRDEASTSREMQTNRMLMEEELKNVRLRQRVAALERELAVAKGERDGGAAPVLLPKPESFRAAAAGAGPDSPLPFPDDAPEQYTPKGFEKVAQRAAKECGMGLEVVALDCSEFPCIAWTQAKDPNVRRYSMSGCAPWEDSFKHGTVVVSTDQADGGTGPRYLSWMAVPPDPSDLLIAVKRAKERNRDMKAALGVP